jgi:glycosyltransferase involved in cell wall biosynthesis
LKTGAKLEELKPTLPGINPIALSFVIPCYFDQENSESLTELLRMYGGYDAELLDRIQFVIVDDGSPVPVSLPEELNLNIRLLRIRENIPWNQGGARNLGVVYSGSDKVLAADLDHLFPEKTLRHIVAMPRLGRKIYRFHRLDTEGNFIKPPPSFFLFSRGRFFKLFGVDEEFCGAYGSEDGMFWRWQRYNGTRFGYLGKSFPTRLRECDRDLSYHTLVRDTSVNHGLKKRKLQELAEWGPIGCHSRKFLAFTWDLVEDQRGLCGRFSGGGAGFGDEKLAATAMI